MDLDNLLVEIDFLISGTYKLYDNKWEGPIKTEHSMNLGGVFLSGGLIDVAFTCNNCGEILFGEAISVPRPNFQEDSISKSRVFGDSEVFVCNCGSEFAIITDSTHGDWDINFDDGYNQPDEFYYKITSDFELEMNYLDYLDENTEEFDVF